MKTTVQSLNSKATFRTFNSKRLQSQILKFTSSFTLLLLLTGSVKAQYQTILPGSFTSATTWLGGVIPPAGAELTISHAVSLRGASVSTGKITIASGGSLTVDSTGGLMASTGLNVSGGSLNVNGGTINIGTSGGDNKMFTLSGGTLKIASGIMNVNGNIVMSSGNFAMTGGALNIDPNTGVSSTSVASGIDIFSLSSSVADNVTAGTITFVDPPFAGTAECLAFTGNTANASWEGATTIFGGTAGINTTAGGTNGFYVDTRATGASYLVLGNVIANGGTGTNRFVSGSNVANNGFDIGGNLTINVNGHVKTFTNGAPLRIKGNLTNNGTYTDFAGIIFGQRTGSNTVMQTVAGNGKFLNAYNTGNLNAPFFTYLTFDNIAKPISVKFAVATTNPNIYISGSAAFVNGVIVIPEINHMYFTNKATATRVNGFMLNYKGRSGQMMKQFGVGASKFTFHIGDNTGNYDYTPVTMEYTTNSQSRWMGVRVEDGNYQYLNTGSTPTDYLTRYFDLYGDLNGTWTAKFTYTYLDEDVVGQEANMKYDRWNGSVWEHYNAAIDSNKFSYTFNQSTLIRHTKGVFTGRNAPAATTTARIVAENPVETAKTASTTLLELAKAKAKISIFPNPARGSKLNIQLNSMPAGKYGITAYNNSGQLIYSNSINHSGGSSTEAVALPGDLPTGIYTLFINDAKKQITKQSVVIQG